MPYIEDIDRSAMDQGATPVSAGELNYLFTEAALRYLRERGMNYQHINDVIGALEGAKLELYRRLAGPYEDTKIQSNGDLKDYDYLSHKI